MHPTGFRPTVPTPHSYEAGKMTHEQASLVKAWNTLRGREVRNAAGRGRAERALPAASATMTTRAALQRLPRGCCGQPPTSSHVHLCFMLTPNSPQPLASTPTSPLLGGCPGTRAAGWQRHPVRIPGGQGLCGHGGLLQVPRDCTSGGGVRWGWGWGGYQADEWGCRRCRALPRHGSSWPARVEASHPPAHNCFRCLPHPTATRARMR